MYVFVSSAGAHQGWMCQISLGLELQVVCELPNMGAGIGLSSSGLCSLYPVVLRQSKLVSNSQQSTASAVIIDIDVTMLNVDSFLDTQEKLSDPLQK